MLPNTPPHSNWSKRRRWYRNDADDTDEVDNGGGNLETCNNLAVGIVWRNELHSFFMIFCKNKQKYVFMIILLILVPFYFSFCWPSIHCINSSICQLFIGWRLVLYGFAWKPLFRCAPLHRESIHSFILLTQLRTLCWSTWFLLAQQSIHHHNNGFSARSFDETRNYWRMTQWAKILLSWWSRWDNFYFRFRPIRIFSSHKACIWSSVLTYVAHCDITILSLARQKSCASVNNSQKYHLWSTRLSSQ